MQRASSSFRGVEWHNKQNAGQLVIVFLWTDHQVEQRSERAYLRLCHC